MSEKGTLSKSIASNISEAIIDKLGGAGYAPSEWKENINLLGIASEDSGFAIASLQEEASTSEKGALSLSIANDVGDILNKKYDTNRGFKMKEVASAVSMLSPLPEKTASGAIAVIEDGADNVPTKSLVVTIPATLSGVSSITETQIGRNVKQNVTDYSLTSPVFFQYRNYYSGQATGYPKLTGTFKVGTYTLSFDTTASITASKVGVWAKKKSDQNWYNLSANGDLVTPTSSGYSFCSVSSGHVTGTFKISEECDALGFGYYQYGTSIPYTNLMLEIGSIAHAYEQYQTPSQYSASLGRTIYGGQVDIVNGTGKETTLRYELDENDTWSAYSGANNSFWHNVATGEDRPIKQTEASESISNYLTYSSASPSSAPDFSFLIQSGQRIVVTADSSIDTVDKFKTWLSTHKIIFVCPASTPESFTFEGQEIPTKLGYNAFWSEQGDTEVVYRAIQTPYERGTLTGGIVNFDDANTNFPLVKLEADLAPTLDGKSAVEFARCGKNLISASNFEQGSINASGVEIDSTSRLRSNYILVNSGADYSFSVTGTDIQIYFVFQYNATGGFISRVSVDATSGSITLDANTKYFRLLIRKTNNATIAPSDLTSIQLEQSVTPTTYEPYNGTTFTASFGRTIYGGSADIVKGEGVSNYSKDSMSSTYLSGLGIDTYIGYEAQTAYFNYHPSIWVRNWHYQDAKSRQAGGIGCVCNYFPVSMHNTTIFASQYRIYFDVDGKNISSVSDFIAFVQNLEANNESLDIAYELATPEDFTFDAQRVEALPGTNNFYNDIGDTDIEYIKTR